MKKTLILFLAFSTFTYAQTQKISLEDIWIKGSFKTKKIAAFHTMKNDSFFTTLNKNNKKYSINKYDYATLKKVETIISENDLQGIDHFDTYVFNEDESKLILGVNLEQIYRHSQIGKYYVYDLNSKNLELISKNLIQEPTFSPDGKNIAFAFQNNLYIKTLKSSKTSQITHDGKKNKIINGITDWVYEEEFAFVRAFQWNGDSDKIAYIRFDETDVPEFSMDIYGEDLYPQKQVFKYPKAGENNSKVSLHIYNVKYEKAVEIDLGKNKQHYLPRIQWTKKENILSVITLNRHQNNINIILVNGNTLESNLLFNEKDKAYISIKNVLTFLKDNSFIWASEKDGFNHLYHYDSKGKLQNQITRGFWEVTNYYGFDEKKNRIFYQSTENGSTNRGVYSIKIKGKNKKKLSKDIGANNAKFSTNYKYFINTFSSVNTPPIYTLNDAKSGDIVQGIKKNSDLIQKLTHYNLPKKEFSILKTKNGNFNMWMIKPNDFNPAKKYPLLMYQYSGPGSQSVKNSWNNANDYWHLMMAQKGYIVVCVDGRGTGFRGRDFKKITYKELGKYETEDQIESAIELGKHNYIDESRIGIWGWSFGGYLSSLAITKGAAIFKTAIAIAPVTSWRFYDTVYTERYMQTPQENPYGYDNNSPINFVNLLKGNYLLIHGSGDDNVHVQNSMRMTKALIKANKQFDLFIYPNKTHSISDRTYENNYTRLHLYNKMTTFIEKNL
ncbi:MAG: S9 family peptidase [Flavobacteriaceae bacterium]|nr:S9 family peptidase [Flavobacteriaceae bacterium]